MKNKFALPVVFAAALGLGACNDPAMEDQIGTGVASGIVGAIAATALGADAGWAAAAGVATGVAGALYAKNQQTNQCAYSTGDGQTVTVSDCK